LQYSLTLPAELRAVPVPPLLLQPLVENAIRHGLEPHVQGGELQVVARVQTLKEQRMLVLDVSDTGVGCVPDDIKEGFGLTQVRERLSTAYSDAARLEIIALTPHGTLIQVYLPLSESI
jgi:LytS/YehU family sensor histidine kinase